MAATGCAEVLSEARGAIVGGELRRRICGREIIEFQERDGEGTGCLSAGIAMAKYCTGRDFK